MQISGLQMHDPRTGLRVHVLHADEAEGRSFELEYSAPPGSPRDLILPHWHQSWSERFEVLSGQGRYRLARREADLHEGDSVELPPGVTHLHPWNTGSAELRVRQTTTLAQPNPASVQETILSFAMLFWLSREGKVDARGMPHPLQAALILQKLQQHGGYLPGLPVAVQTRLINTLAAWGRRRGYVAFNPACMRA